MSHSVDRDKIYDPHSNAQCIPDHMSPVGLGLESSWLKNLPSKNQKKKKKKRLHAIACRLWNEEEMEEAR